MGKVTAPSTVGSATFTTGSVRSTGSTTVSTPPRSLPWRSTPSPTAAHHPEDDLQRRQTPCTSGSAAFPRTRATSDPGSEWRHGSNTSGTGRPDTTSGGQLPSNYLQYPPTASAPDAWNLLSNYENQTCPALSSSNGAAWSLQLTQTSIGTVTLPAFIGRQIADGLIRQPRIAGCRGSVADRDRHRGELRQRCRRRRSRGPG